MPRCFFNLHDDRDMPDPTGLDLPDLAAARQIAIERVGTILAEADDRGISSTGWRLDITDERGLVLAWFHVETDNIPAVEGIWADARSAPAGPSTCARAIDSFRAFRKRH